jgi:DNA polymerase elongation subunit (family B)
MWKATRPKEDIFLYQCVPVETPHRCEEAIHSIRQLVVLTGGIILVMKRILVFDLETSPAKGYAFGKYDQTLLGWESRDTIGSLMCIAWRWLDEKKTHVVSLNDVENEKALLDILWGLFDKADVLLGHNIDNFDVKYANGRFFFHGMTPPAHYDTVDTLKIARRRFRFPSNSMDDLAFYLGLDGKIETGGKKLWLNCMKGDQRAWRLMKKYNKWDVDLNIQIYERMLGWSVKTIHTDFDRPACSACGSNGVQNAGFESKGGSKHQRWKCTSCGSNQYTGVKGALPLRVL